MNYSWKSASRIRADAQAAGRVCEELEATVGLTAKTLLEASRPESAPLHSEFEWDDAEAAELYREDQARHIINCLVIKADDDEKAQTPVRAFFKIEEATYESTVKIMSSDQKRQALLRQALAEFTVYQNKYASLEELVPVFQAAEEVRRETA